jgi:hypothetical protein
MKVGEQAVVEAGIGKRPKKSILKAKRKWLQLRIYIS